MPVQDEVTWLLETIKRNWPEDDRYGEGTYGSGLYSAGAWPDNVARINRDAPRILETDERRRELELERWSAIGAGLASRTTEPRGTEYDHYVETVLSVRIEALHAGEWGQTASAADFEELVARTRAAILSERSYPDVAPDAAGEPGYVCYQDLRVEGEQDLSHEHKDYFRRDFDVRLTGVEELPDL